MSLHIAHSRPGGPTLPAGDRLDLRESFFRKLVEESVGLMTVIDRAGTILFVNVAAQRLFGCRATDLVGRSAFEFTHPEEDALVRGTLAESTRRAQPLPLFEHRLRHKDGSWRTVESVCRSLHDGPFGPIVVIHSRDISDRKTLEAQLGKLLDAQLWGAQRLAALGPMTASIAVEFDHLLTAVVGRADRLLGAEMSDAAREDAFELRRTADRAVALLDQLLASGRYRMRGNPQTIDVNAAIADMSCTINRLLGKAVRVTSALHALAPVVLIDRGLFEQVIVSLLADARDAMPAGGEVTIRTRNGSPAEHVASAAGSIVIELAYEGTSLTEGGAERRPSSVGGIVRHAGGYIDVNGEEGQARVVRVVLPRDATAVT